VRGDGQAHPGVDVAPGVRIGLAGGELDARQQGDHGAGLGEDGEVGVRGEGRVVDGHAPEFGAEFECPALGELIRVQARFHACNLARAASRYLFTRARVASDRRTFASWRATSTTSAKVRVSGSRSMRSDIRGLSLGIVRTVVRGRG